MIVLFLNTRWRTTNTKKWKKIEVGSTNDKIEILAKNFVLKQHRPI